MGALNSGETIQGLTKYTTALQDLSLDLGTRKLIIARSLRVGVEPMRQKMQDIAPRDTGHYAGEFMIMIVDQTATGATAKVGASRSGFQGNFNEGGTEFIPARPTLRPAFDSTVEECVDRYGEEMARQIILAFK